MKFEKLKPGMTVYSVRKTKMGNTTLTTVSVWDVIIKEVRPETRTVLASWNGNTPEVWHERQYKAWKEKEPKLVSTGIWSQKRFARRGEK